MPSYLGRTLVLIAFAACLASVIVVDAQDKPPHPGKAPYDRVCKVCHGEDAKGNAGPALVPFEMDDDALLARVREGGGEMPPFSTNRVSDEEVKQIGAYLRSLSIAP